MKIDTKRNKKTPSRAIFIKNVNYIADINVIDIFLQNYLDEYNDIILLKDRSNIFNGKVPADDLKIMFKSYSIYGHISDLCIVLFVQSERPWKSAKYDKRRNRLLY